MTITTIGDPLHVLAHRFATATDARERCRTTLQIVLNDYNRAARTANETAEQMHAAIGATVAPVTHAELLLCPLGANRDAADVERISQLESECADLRETATQAVMRAEAAEQELRDARKEPEFDDEPDRLGLGTPCDACINGVCTEHV